MTMRGIESVEFPKIIKKHAVDLIKQLCSPGLWPPPHKIALLTPLWPFFGLWTKTWILFSEPETRLGSELGVIELKHHKWLRDFDFDALYRSQLTSPIKVNSVVFYRNGRSWDRPLSWSSTFGIVFFCHWEHQTLKFLFQPELKGKIDTSQFENFSCATIDDSPPDETSGWDNEF